MFQRMERSKGPVVGYQVIGTIIAEDYATLVPEIQALVDQYDDIYLLLDLGEFRGEAVGAWLADLRFGREFRDDIERLAIVGDKKWQEWLAKLAEPFYAEEARFFHLHDIEEAWVWLQGDD